MPLSVRWDLGKDAAREVATALNALLADAFALLVKTKGIRWHVSGPCVPGLRQLLSEMEAQAETTIEGIAELSGLRRTPARASGRINSFMISSRLALSSA